MTGLLAPTCGRLGLFDASGTLERIENAGNNSRYISRSLLMNPQQSFIFLHSALHIGVSCGLPRSSLYMYIAQPDSTPATIPTAMPIRKDWMKPCINGLCLFFCCWSLSSRALLQWPRRMGWTFLSSRLIRRRPSSAVLRTFVSGSFQDDGTAASYQT